jgi:hypothetical protein
MAAFLLDTLNLQELAPCLFMAAARARSLELMDWLQQRTGVLQAILQQQGQDSQVASAARCPWLMRLSFCSVPCTAGPTGGLSAALVHLIDGQPATQLLRWFAKHSCFDEEACTRLERSSAGPIPCPGMSVVQRLCHQDDVEVGRLPATQCLAWFIWPRYRRLCCLIASIDGQALRLLLEEICPRLPSRLAALGMVPALIEIACKLKTNTVLTLLLQKLPYRPVSPRPRTAPRRPLAPAWPPAHHHHLCHAHATRVICALPAARR